MPSLLRGHSALRRGRVSLPNHAYLLTAICADRREAFAAFEPACIAARALSEPAAWGNATLLAWVLMPDHWHGLATLGEGQQLSSLMQRIKGRSSRAYTCATGENATLWARGFYDRALRTDEDLRVAARYVVANPLRAGLVQRLGDYPFWDSIWGEESLRID